MILTDDKTKVAVIAASLLNKYNDLNYENLEKIITDIFTGTHDNKISKEIKKSPDYNALKADIERQIIIFNYIEQDWIHAPLNLELLKKINFLSRGIKESENIFRLEDYVADFGGNALTPVSEVQVEFENLSNLLKKAESISNEKIKIQAALMARIFFEIIRIHPFTDGNGRTARFVIQILALKSGYSYIVIPKYRNNKVWKSALDQAKKNNMKEMESFILKLLK